MRGPIPLPKCPPHDVDWDLQCLVGHIDVAAQKLAPPCGMCRKCHRWIRPGAENEPPVGNLCDQCGCREGFIWKRENGWWCDACQKEAAEKVSP